MNHFVATVLQKHLVENLMFSRRQFNAGRVNTDSLWFCLSDYGITLKKFCFN